MIRALAAGDHGELSFRGQTQVEEQPKKKPIFTPIVLILLTMSLIGNMFLYTKSLQNSQDDRVARGTAIMTTGNTAKIFFDQAITDIGEWVAGKDDTARAAAKSKLLVAYAQANAVTAFIAEAEKTNGQPFPAAKRQPAEFIAQSLQSLQIVGNHDGALQENELAYLQLLERAFKTSQEALSSFSHDTVNKEQSLLILVDKQWPPIAGKISEAMNEPDEVAFKLTK